MPEPDFKPVSLAVTLETREEYDELYALCLTDAVENVAPSLSGLAIRNALRGVTGISANIGLCLDMDAKMGRGEVAK